jgi:hypothetical protein
MVMLQGLTSPSVGFANQNNEIPTVVSRSECFPLESLSLELKVEAERILLRALDTEALYTLLDTIKPISSGVASLQIPKSDLNPKATQDLKAILSTFHCGPDIGAFLQRFHQEHEGSIYFEAVFYRNSSVQKAVQSHPTEFIELGISTESGVENTVNAVDKGAFLSRFKTYGYLFGYPEHAVEFFADAAHSQAQTGKFVERDFYNVPTFSGEKGRFVWAVPKFYIEGPQDKVLKMKAERTLSWYTALRSQYIGEGKLGISELLRNIFCASNGQCSSEF